MTTNLHRQVVDYDNKYKQNYEYRSPQRLQPVITANLTRGDYMIIGAHRLNGCL